MPEIQKYLNSYTILSYNPNNSYVTFKSETFLIDNKKTNYLFSIDENENIICTFIMSNNYIVTATEFKSNKILTFNIKINDDNENSENLTEEEFSTNFYDEYQNFKSELQKYKNKEPIDEDIPSNSEQNEYWIINEDGKNKIVIKNLLSFNEEQVKAGPFFSIDIVVLYLNYFNEMGL